MLILPAVFAREKLDIGSRLLYPRRASSIDPAGRRFRAGSGLCNGVLGLAALAKGGFAGFQRRFKSGRARARHNVERAFPEAGGFLSLRRN